MEDRVFILENRPKIDIDLDALIAEKLKSDNKFRVPRQFPKDYNRKKKRNRRIVKQSRKRR